MTLAYEKNKENIKRWRAKHREHLNKLHRGYMKDKYIPILPYSYDHICRVFRAIRID